MILWAVGRELSHLGMGLIGLLSNPTKLAVVPITSRHPLLSLAVENLHRDQNRKGKWLLWGKASRLRVEVCLQ